ncbi:MAG TPA: hypothetical protein V6C99_04690 [Oculatellaceae cyanobacterium]
MKKTIRNTKKPASKNQNLNNTIKTYRVEALGYVAGSDSETKWILRGIFNDAKKAMAELNSDEFVRVFLCGPNSRELVGQNYSDNDLALMNADMV